MQTTFENDNKKISSKQTTLIFDHFKRIKSGAKI